MNVSPVSDDTVFKKWNSVSEVDNLENFSFPGMKGPSNVSVRLDLFPERKTPTNKMELTGNDKNKDDDSEFSKWHETEQLNHQVVFINPEWDEIEEEKSGISSFLNSMTPNGSSAEKAAHSQVTEFVVTDTESVSSVTVSLDEFTEESEEIVAVISDSEAEVFHAELFTQMEKHADENASEKKVFPIDEVVATESWKETDPLKFSTLDDSDAPNTVPHTDKGKSSDNFLKKKGGNDPFDATKLMKASCYVVQNGKIQKPFYIVKNPILREDAIYKNINKSEDISGKKGFKIQNGNSEEERSLRHLGRNSARKRDTFREPQPAKFGRNQEFIRIIEHPARTKKIIVNKMIDPKVNINNISNNNDPVNNADHSHHPHHLHHSHYNHHHHNHEANPKKEIEEIYQRNPSSDTETNACEGEDLMWLLDFKLDDFFSESSLPALSQLDDSLERYSEFPGKFVEAPASNFSESDVDDKIRVEIGCQTETLTTRSNKITGNKAAGGGKQQHRIEGKSDSALPSRTFSDLKRSENRKPPFTYTELIECALQEKGPLTVSEIYNWISETFPYYKSWDDRWKNSVRHNLSINPYFRKGTKARQGSGHLWTVNKSDDNSKINSWKRHRFHEFEEFSKRLRYTGEAEKQETFDCVSTNGIIDETELATASIEDKENRRLHRDVLMAACIDNNFISTANVSLEQSAEEILSGVKKNVEVQYLEPVKSPCEDDFLNPISKEILMGECGLLNQIELNLTAETGEHLGIVDGMTDSEHIFGIPDELNFPYDMPSHGPQLLPLAK